MDAGVGPTIRERGGGGGGATNRVNNNYVFNVHASL